MIRVKHALRSQTATRVIGVTQFIYVSQTAQESLSQMNAKLVSCQDTSIRMAELVLFLDQEPSHMRLSIKQQEQGWVNQLLWELEEIPSMEQTLLMSWKDSWLIQKLMVLYI